jgi:hypothetical protein
LISLESKGDSLRIKAIFVIGIILLLVPMTYGEGSISEPGAKTGKAFRYIAKKFGVPILMASIKIGNEFSEEGRSLYRVEAQVNSLPYLGIFFRMKNRFTSTVVAETCSPIRYVKEIDQEGLLTERKNYLQTLTFDPNGKKVVIERPGEKEKREVSLPTETYDPLSMFARCYLKEELHPGQEIRMSIYDGVKLRQMIFHAKKERVKSKVYGEVETVCLESTTSFSTFGDKEGRIRIWYTADARKTPISMELDLPVGSVKFDLEEAEEI